MHYKFNWLEIKNKIIKKKKAKLELFKYLTTTDILKADALLRFSVSHERFHKNSEVWLS